MLRVTIPLPSLCSCLVLLLVGEGFRPIRVLAVAVESLLPLNHTKKIRSVTARI
jgi:hypothetical protein